MTLTTGLHILDFLLGIFVGLLLFIFSVNVIKKITVFTKKAPILKIVDKRTVNKIDGHRDNSGTKKRKTSCGMSTTKKEDADLISNLKMGQLGTLQSTIQAINKEIDVDLHSCLTTQVENLHAVGHFKDEFPTVLNFARNLGNSVYESIKRITSWAAYYFTHPTSYYPIPDNSISLKEISKLPHLGKTRHLDSKQAQMMREWAVLHGKCVRQRTVRQETTKFKAGTLPLNMYRPSLSDYPKEKVNLFQNHMPDAPIIAHEEEEREEEEQEQEENGVTSNLQEDEYDTDSEHEHAVDDDNDDDDDDTLTFMRAVTTRSGRAVRVRFFS